MIPKIRRLRVLYLDLGIPSSADPKISEVRDDNDPFHADKSVFLDSRSRLAPAVCTKQLTTRTPEPIKSIGSLRGAAQQAGESGRGRRTSNAASSLEKCLESGDKGTGMGKSDGT